MHSMHTSSNLCFYFSFSPTKNLILFLLIFSVEALHISLLKAKRVTLKKIVHKDKIDADKIFLLIILCQVLVYLVVLPYTLNFFSLEFFFFIDKNSFLPKKSHVDEGMETYEALEEMKLILKNFPREDDYIALLHNLKW